VEEGGGKEEGGGGGGGEVELKAGKRQGVAPAQAGAAPSVSVDAALSY
jgi:hypothetical protein